MLISKAMNTKLNDQVSNELGASQAYLATACMFEEMGLKALAVYFRKQTEEERGHALKIIDYVLAVGGKVKLAQLVAPKSDYPTAKAAIDAALKHELKVTSDINDLVALAEKERDYASRSFLQWFVDEQVEEVSSMEHLMRIAEMAGVNLLQLESYVRHMLAPKS
jgi:ferritin